MSPVSRRRLLAGAAGVAGLVTAAAACGGGGGPAGRLRVAVAGGGSRERLDPHVLVQQIDQIRARACYDTLVGYSPAMVPEPRLAQSWDVDATGTRWRTRLAPARFHDGRLVTPADVLYSFRRIADPATKASAAGLYRGVDLAASRAVGERDVEVVLTAPNFLFPISWGATGAEIVPAGATDFSRPVGSGPFRFVSFSPGGPALYRAFEGYRDGAPPARELEIVPIDQEPARVGALLSGQVAVAYDVAATSVRRLGSDARARVLTVPEGTNQFLCLKVDRAPFADPRLRRAAALGLDREALVRVALQDRGRVGNDLRGRGLQYYDDAIPQVSRDVAAARALVDAAGARGLPVEILTSTVDPVFTPAASLIAGQLGEIGLAVTTRTIPPEGYFTEIQRSGDWNAAVAAGVGGVDAALPNTARWGRFDRATPT